MRPLIRSLTARSELAASVVIVTRNRCSYLDLTLASIERQVFPLAYCEVMVADEDSSDHTEEVISRHRQRGCLKIEHLRVSQTPDRAASYNQAIERAKGEIIVFLGDDQLLFPNFLAQHLKHHLGNERFVLGDAHLRVHTHLFASSSFELPPGCPPAPLLSADQLEDEANLSAFMYEGENHYAALWEHFGKKGEVPPYPWVFFEGSNASVRRDVAIKSGFAQGIAGWNCGGWGLECRDFALRLHEAEIPFIFEPQAISAQQLSPRSSMLPFECATNIRFFFSRHPHLDPVRVEPLLWK